MPARVAHLSDVHLRSGGRSRCRADEYEAVVDATVESVRRALADAGPDERAVVITGDVFHDKGNAGRDAISLFFRLVRGLAASAPVFIIAGNHDYVHERSARADADRDAGDLIEVLLSEASVPGAVYLSETGLHEAPPFGFGLLSVRDATAPGAGSAGGWNEDRHGAGKGPCPPLPDPSGFSSAVRYRIALFHGLVSGGPTTARWLSGYHFGMLGDDHLAAAWAGPSGAPVSWTSPGTPAPTWGYAGSLVQQNHGEDAQHHGFLLWDLDERAVSLIDVKSPHAFLTMCRGPTDDWGVSLGGGFDRVSGARTQGAVVPLGDASLPESATVRVLLRGIASDASAAGGAAEGDAVAALAARGCRAIKTTLAVAASGAALAPTDVRAALCSDTPVPHHVFLSPAAWERHVEGHGDPARIAGHPVGAWMRSDASHLALPDLPPAVAEACGLSAARLDERNHAIRRAAALAAEAVAAPSPSSGMTLVVTRLSWRWLHCYGAGSHFDFRRASGRVVLIHGPNASGKTGFMEILLLAMFGRPPPSRLVRDDAAACINRRAPAGEVPGAEVSFRLGDREYEIRREFRVKRNDVAKLGAGGAWLSLLPSGETIRSKRPAVDRWVAENIGSLDALVMSSVVSQDRDCDFPSMSAADQRAAIDAAVGAHTMARCLDAIDEARRAHKWLADALDSSSRALAGRAGDAVDDRALLASGRDVAECRRRLAVARANEWAAGLLLAVRKSKADADRDHDRRRPPSCDRPPGVDPAIDHDLAVEALALARRSAADLAARLAAHEASARPPRATSASLGRVRALRAGLEDLQRPAESAGDLRRQQSEQSVRAKLLRGAVSLLGSAEELDGPLASTPGPGTDCAACRARHARLGRLRAEVDALGSPDPLMEEARLGDLAVVAERFEELDAHLAAVAEMEAADQRERAAHAAKAEDLLAQQRDAAGLVARLDAEARLAGAWKAWRAWEAWDSASGGDAGRTSRAAVRAAIDVRTGARHDSAEARVALGRAVSHRATIVDRRIRARRDAATAADARAAADVVRSREGALSHAHALLTGYSETAYRSSVSAALQDAIRMILRCIGFAGFTAAVEWTQTSGFRFSIAGPAGESIPLERTSGYQRAAIGLATRIALSRLGGHGGARCSQLFLDEAFSNFDETRRADVGEFLRGLLSSFECVILVSHVLPPEARDECVPIRRTDAGDSIISYD